MIKHEMASEIIKSRNQTESNEERGVGLIAPMGAGGRPRHFRQNSIRSEPRRAGEF